MSIHGEIPKKLCGSHHASTHISEKLCFRLEQKNNPLNVQMQFFQFMIGKKRTCISFASQKKFTQKRTIQCTLHKKRHYSVISNCARLVASPQFSIPFLYNLFLSKEKPVATPRERWN